MDNKVQVVILCGGRGTRLAPLTDELPKVLVDVCGLSILEHKLEILDDIASEIILIVGYLGDMIREKIGDSYKGVPVKYVEQKEQLGTGHAILCAKEYLDSRFMVLNGDDIYEKEDLLKLCEHEFAILAKEVENPKSFGVLELDHDGCLSNLIEKPDEPPSNLANMGVYVFTPDIFEYELPLSKRGEYEITDYVNFLLSKGEKINVVPTNFWIPIGNVDQLEVGKRHFKCAE